MYDKLNKIQLELKAPKNQRNNFGGYNYRSVEDIMKGLKPLLEKYKCVLVLTDEIISIQERIYLQATATFIDVEDNNASISVRGLAREPLSMKGQSDPQLTGSCSSYARKYALNGLFCIDDTKDIDSMNNTKEEPKPRTRRSRIVKQDESCPF